MTTSERDEYCPHTLCEVCTKACGGCSWSEKGVQMPVEGWEAIRYDIPQPKAFYAESYVVLKCPEFELEEHNAWAFKKFNPEQARRRLKHKESVRKAKRLLLGQKKPKRAILATGG